MRVGLWGSNGGLQQKTDVRHEKQKQLKMDLEQQRWTEELRKEIAVAHQEWINASTFFEIAEGKDQIDYAIFAMIAAEKRYEMLLRLAKKTNKVWPRWEGMPQ